MSPNIMVGFADRKQLLLIVLLSVVVAGLLGLGLAIGYRWCSRSQEQLFREIWQTHALGEFLEEDSKAEFALAYLDPEKALREMNNYSWSVANIPTPFVGSAPRPGPDANARINSMQFRSHSEVSLPKPPGVFRLFLTGGSAAYSAGAPSQDRTLGAYLEDLLNKREKVSKRLRYEVFTFANPAWASTQERIAIENRLSELEPDLVISFSGANDVFWAKSGRDILWFRTFQDQFFWQLINTSYLLFGRDALVDSVRIDREPVKVQLVAERLRKNLHLAATALSMRDARYLFVLQPTLYTTHKKLSSRESDQLKKKEQQYFMNCYQTIEKQLTRPDKNPFFFVSMDRVFDHYGPDQEIFIDSFHFGDRGNQLLSERLFLAVRDAMEESGTPSS